MKVFVVLLAVAALAYGNPIEGGNVIMTFGDDGQTPIYEDLDEPVQVIYGVDVNKLHFMLYTRTNRDSPQEVKVNDAAGLKKTNFKASSPTKFLIHGWQNSYQAESVQIVKDAYLQSGDVNVIIVDYEAYNAPYLSAVGNAESIGTNVGNLVNFLITQGLTVSNVHITGHSLGAHIAGYAANKVSGKVPRVTGLDPAGPLFAGAKANARLSNDDATVVDIIHTSTSLGIDQAIGTVDFYPHGGSGQPSCSGNLMGDGCDHAASYRYFAQTVTERTRFPARACNSEKEAKVADPAKNTCGKSTVLMGEDGNKGASGFFYVQV